MCTAMPGSLIHFLNIKLVTGIPPGKFMSRQQGFRLNFFLFICLPHTESLTDRVTVSSEDGPLELDRAASTGPVGPC
jgi:hypothetical protein